MQYSLLPHRARFGTPRPEALRGCPLPPARMPSHDGMRPLKAWRYVGVYGPELMLCLGAVRIGRARQTFWAIWDRANGRLLERTTLGRGALQLAPGVCRLREHDVQAELTLEETDGIETVCPSGDSYAWTRKQGGIRARGTIMLGGEPRTVDAFAVVDDTAAYYARHTRWRWSAGVGRADDGRAVAWNLVAGVNDPPHDSERTVWIDGEPFEAPPSTFAADLSAVDGLRFETEATRERRENLVLVRSFYRQPFGTFSGQLPGGLGLAEGFGVMEDHVAAW